MPRVDVSAPVLLYAPVALHICPAERLNSRIDDGFPMSLSCGSRLEKALQVRAAACRERTYF